MISFGKNCGKSHMRLKVVDYITVNEKQFRIENIFTLVLLFVSETFRVMFKLL